MLFYCGNNIKLSVGDAGTAGYTTYNVTCTGSASPEVVAADSDDFSTEFGCVDSSSKLVASSKITAATPPAAAMQIAVGSSSPFRRAGDKITVSFKVQNTGLHTLTGVTIKPTPSFDTTCQHTDLEPNTSTVCTGTYASSGRDFNASKTTASGYATAVDSEAQSSRAVKSNTASVSVARTKATAGSAALENNINAGSLPQVEASQSTLQALLSILFGIIGGVAILVISVGGLRYIFGNGDPNQIAQAKNTIIYALIGLVVAISGYSIVTFVVKSL